MSGLVDASAMCSIQQPVRCSAAHCQAAHQPAMALVVTIVSLRNDLREVKYCTGQMWLQQPTQLLATFHHIAQRQHCERQASLSAAFPSAHRVSERKECGVLPLLLPQRQVALQVLQGGHVDVNFARSQLGNTRVLCHQAISRH